MTQLIIVSALLGVGAGIIIPLSTSLVSKFFSGDQRTKQYGYVSALTNITLVVATAVTGYLADIQWRLPFVVYLLPLVSIMLVPAIRESEKSISIKKESVAVNAVAGEVNYGVLVKYMLYYLLITYLVMVVSIDMPFLLGKYGYDSGVSGMVTSVFFIAMMLPGLFINRIIAVLRGSILLVSLLLIALGLVDVFFNSSLIFIILGCVATGFGYGIAQPYIYDVTASLAPPQKSTYALALLMTMNYVAILISPFLVDWMQELLGLKGERYPFVLNAVVGGIALLFLLVRRVWVKRN
jgi:MFS family permease